MDVSLFLLVFIFLAWEQMPTILLSCWNFDKDTLSSISLRQLPFPAAPTIAVWTQRAHERPSLKVCVAAIAGLGTELIAKLRGSWRKIPTFIFAPHCCSRRQRHSPELNQLEDVQQEGCGLSCLPTHKHRDGLSCHRLCLGWQNLVLAGHR